MFISTVCIPAVGFPDQLSSPFTDGASVRVLLFARTDCPLTKRYGPELARIFRIYESRGVKFWLIYPPGKASQQAIHDLQTDYQVPGIPVPDGGGQIAKRAHCTVSPEVAVFNGSGKLEYHGRIDDRWSDFGRSRPIAQNHDLQNAIESVLQHRPVVPAETRAVGCALADIN